MAIIISATWTAEPGKEDIVLDALAKFVPASNAEPGCRVYYAHRDPEVPWVFKFFEIYEDEAAMQAHGASDHFQQYALGQALPVLTSRDAEITELLEF